MKFAQTNRTVWDGLRRWEEWVDKQFFDAINCHLLTYALPLMGKGTHSITFIFHNTDNITICVPQLLPARISNTILLLIVSIPYGVIFYHEFQDTLCHVEIVDHLINYGNKNFILSYNRCCWNSFCALYIVAKRFIQI